MWTFKDYSHSGQESGNLRTPPRSKNKTFVDSRIDLFYKSTKVSKQADNSAKRTISNTQVTTSRNCDNKNKQKTLSPWLIKESNFGTTIHDLKRTPSRTPRKQRRRKPSTPKRSASSWDPNFRGATVWFNRPTRVSGDESQLMITSSFSNTRQQKQLKPRRRYSHDSFSETKSSSENEEIPDITNFPVSLGKTCASCHTRRTPLWRDAEDGTPLCNACGIRYRKYRVRCSYCWHIPKKDCKAYQICPLCGSDLKCMQCRKTS